MPENRDDKYCPVALFKKYISHLHPDNEYMWQTPNHHPKDKESNIWYTKAHLGKNTLGPFMKNVSIKCGLSKIYTNHCIHVTAASILTRCNFSSKEIMSVTGHKSVQNLTIYQRVRDEKKIEMGNILTKSLQTTDQNLPLAVTGPPLAKVITANEQRNDKNQEPNDTAIVPYEPNFDDGIDDINLLALIADVQNDEKEKEITQPKPQRNQIMMTTNTMNARSSPLFHNCKIGNINITINKQWLSLLSRRTLCADTHYIQLFMLKIIYSITFTLLLTFAKYLWLFLVVEITNLSIFSK